MARVYWQDAASYKKPEDIDWLKENATTVKFCSVGHVIKMGRKTLILAFEINDENHARDTEVIPRSDIERIEYLEVR